MAHDDPLGDARRAAGEDGIQWVGVNHLGTDAFEQRLVALLLNDGGIVHHHARETDFAECLGILGGHRDGSDGVEHLGNEANAGSGHLVVDGHIEIAALDHAHEAHQAFNLAVDKHQHGAAHRSRQAGDVGADALCHRQPLGKGEGVLVVGKRRLVRETAGSSLEIGQDVVNHFFS